MVVANSYMDDLRVHRSPCGLLLYGKDTMLVRALVGLELRSYREAIASALQFTRPQAVVSTAEPVALDSEISRLKPQVVICSQSTPVVRDGVPCWVEMSIVKEELCAEVSIDGQTRKVPNITLAELVSVVDEAEALAQG